MSSQRRDVATIQFFNTLIENVLQGLSPSETKVLLLVARQTMGWTDGKGGRKAQDWMTNKYLQERSHLSHTSVSAAIESLVKKNLIVVKDEAGQILYTPAERRRCSRLLFSLVSSPGLRDSATAQQPIPKNGKDKITVPHFEELVIVEPQPLRVQKSGMVKAIESPVQDFSTMQNFGKLRLNSQPDKRFNLLPMQNIGFQKLETTNKKYINNKKINHTLVDSKKLNALKAHNDPQEPMQNFGNVNRERLFQVEGLPEVEHLEVLNNENTYEERQSANETKPLIQKYQPMPDEDVQEIWQNEGGLQLPHADKIPVEEHHEEPHVATLPLSLSIEAREVLNAYRQQFRQYFPDAMIPKATQSDFEKLESYFEKHKPQVLISLLPTFFTVDYDFNSRNEYSLHAFVYSVNILLYGMRRLTHFMQIKNTER